MSSMDVYGGEKLWIGKGTYNREEKRVREGVHLKEQEQEQPPTQEARANHIGVRGEHAV